MKEEKIFDFEQDWKQVPTNKPNKMVFVNANRDTFFRVIDIKEETYHFTDLGRVTKVVDINKVLVGESNSEELKKKYLKLIIMLADEIRPIDIPYKVDDLSCYIEAFPGIDPNYDDTIGILYFRDNETTDMIECKRFFHVNPVCSRGYQFEEIRFDDYSKLKTKWLRRCEENVDQSAEQDTGEQHSGS